MSRVPRSRATSGADLTPQAEWTIAFANQDWNTPWTIRLRRARLGSNYADANAIGAFQDAVRDDLRRMINGAFYLPGEYVRVALYCTSDGWAFEGPDPNLTPDLTEIVNFGLWSLVAWGGARRVRECRICSDFYCAMHLRGPCLCTRCSTVANRALLRQKGGAARAAKHYEKERERRDRNRAGAVERFRALHAEISAATRRGDSATEEALRSEQEQKREFLRQVQRAKRLTTAREKKTAAVVVEIGVVDPSQVLVSPLSAGSLRSQRPRRSNAVTRTHGPAR